MRHKVAGRRLNRTTAHRIAMERNLVQSLIEHGRVRTTIPKAKEVRRLAEKLVTLAIDGSLHARQRAIALLNDRQIIPKDHRAAYDAMSDAKREKVLRSRSGRRYRASTTRPGVKFTSESVIHKLFSEIGPKMRQRNEKRNCSGGYTRIIRLADRRLGDATQLCLLEWVSPDDPPRQKNKDNTERKRRAKVKYAFYAGKPLPRRRARRGGKPQTAEAASESQARPADETPAETAGGESSES